MRRTFNRYGKVKKAWLQLPHKQAEPANKNHRGFGFVVFHDIHSITRLLGEDLSKFVCLDGGVKLEVKHAVAKECQPADAVKSPPCISHTTAQSMRSTRATPQGSTADTSQFQKFGSPCSMAAPTTPHTFQGQAVIVGMACVNLPSLPPFPCMDHSTMQWQPLCSNQPFIAPAFQSLPETTTASQCPMSLSCPTPSQPQLASVLPDAQPQLASVLQDGFLGQNCHDSKELERILRAAMSEAHYDD